MTVKELRSLLLPLALGSALGLAFTAYTPRVLASPAVSSRVRPALMKLQQSIGTGQIIEVWDNITAGYVRFTCGSPAPKTVYLRQTAAAGTPAPALIPLGTTGQMNTLPVWDGANLTAEPGQNGKLSVLTGDDSQCTQNQHELETVVISSMGGALVHTADEGTIGQFMCVRITPGVVQVNGVTTPSVLKFSGTLNWHIENR